MPARIVAAYAEDGMQLSVEHDTEHRTVVLTVTDKHAQQTLFTIASEKQAKVIFRNAIAGIERGIAERGDA